MLIKATAQGAKGEIITAEVTLFGEVTSDGRPKLKVNGEIVSVESAKTMGYIIISSSGQERMLLQQGGYFLSQIG